MRRGADDVRQVYGAEAGNLALRAVATSGVYVGGGIAPKILPALQDGSFIAAFRAKGAMAELLARMPVSVILNPEAGLLGAAVHAQELLTTLITRPGAGEARCASAGRRNRIESRAYLDLSDTAQYAGPSPAASLRITLNGEPYETDGPLSMPICSRGWRSMRAGSPSSTISPSSGVTCSQTTVNEGDRIEIVNFVGGG